MSFEQTKLDVEPVLHPGGVHALPLADPLLESVPLAGPQGPLLQARRAAAAAPKLHQGGPVHDGLGPADVLYRLEHLKVDRLRTVAGFFAKILAQFACPRKRCFGPTTAAAGRSVAAAVVVVIVEVEEVLLVGEVAEVVGGCHLELVVLQRRQQQR